MMMMMMVMTMMIEMILCDGRRWCRVSGALMRRMFGGLRLGYVRNQSMHVVTVANLNRVACV